MAITADTHYVVRDATGNLWVEATTSVMVDGKLAQGEPFAAFVTPAAEIANRYASRADAEAVAAQHGGTVQRIDVQTRTIELGLRWVERPCRGQCHHWALHDGEAFECTVNTDVDGDDWYVHDWDGEQVAGPFTTVEEAKAAAVEAVKATWT